LSNAHSAKLAQKFSHLLIWINAQKCFLNFVTSCEVSCSDSCWCNLVFTKKLLYSFYSYYRVCIVRMVAIPCQSSKTNRICAKKVHQKPSLSYKDRLSRLGLDSLELRRLRYDLLLTYKIVFSLTDVVASDNQLFDQLFAIY